MRNSAEMLDASHMDDMEDDDPPSSMTMPNGASATSSNERLSDFGELLSVEPDGSPSVFMNSSDLEAVEKLHSIMMGPPSPRGDDDDVDIDVDRSNATPSSSLKLELDMAEADLLEARNNLSTLVFCENPSQANFVFNFYSNHSLSMIQVEAKDTRAGRNAQVAGINS